MVMSSRKKENWNRIRENVINYLKNNSNNPSDLKSICFYGVGGEGKSMMVNNLRDLLIENGYCNFTNEIPVSLGVDTRDKIRSNTWVIDTCESSVLDDDRFVVFDFTKNGQ